MEVHIISLFPNSIEPYLESSIMKKAQEKGLFRYYVHNLADWSTKNTRRVDDRPFGGWAWTIITIEPIIKCIRELIKNFGDMEIFLMSPKWKIINQEFLEKKSIEKQKILIICGHYEWIDNRIFDFFEINEISIWEYIISSWELWALVFIDGVVRLIKWVISEESLEEESFSIKLWRKKEYPQYSRPRIFEWVWVPEVLLSWNPKKIEEWKKNSLSN